jgi:hypothetical protein
MSDGRKQNGGARTGAGRKPKADEVQLIERLSPLDDVALNALKEGVANGDYNFVKLFMEYRYGKPKQAVDLTTNGKDLHTAIANFNVYNTGPALAHSEEEAEKNV